MAKFTVYYNNEIINSYDIKEPVITIGRLPENTISIANMCISRRHVRVERNSDNNYILTDLNSLNGTYVNNTRVKRSSLVSGDIISIGKYSIVFENPENPEKESIIKEVAAPTTSVSASSSTRVVATDENTVEKKPDSLQTITETPNDVSVESTSAVLIETNRHIVYKVNKPIIKIGNCGEDDIVLIGRFLGKVLITIERQGNETWIQSKSILVKMKINGKSTKLHRLEHKDKIEIGKNTFRYMENS